MNSIVSTIAALVAFALLATRPADVSAFSPQLPAPSTSATSKTLLKYNIIAPPEDDDDTECEESIFERKRREKQEEEADLRQKYADSGLNLSEIDKMESVDQYSNPTGGGLIPGVHLTALMEDD